MTETKPETKLIVVSDLSNGTGMTYKVPYDFRLQDYLDFEADLGVRLSVLKEAQEKGLYYVDAYGFVDYCPHPSKPEYSTIFHCYIVVAYKKGTENVPPQYNDTITEVRLNEYGKSWALTEEEINNDKLHN